jgi:hypothetical protein
VRLGQPGADPRAWRRWAAVKSDASLAQRCGKAFASRRSLSSLPTPRGSVAGARRAGHALPGAA